MAILRTERFQKDFARLPDQIQERAERALRRLAGEPRHPSLRLKKMEGAAGIWECRVSDNYRITFQLASEGILLRRIGTHDMLRRP